MQAFSQKQATLKQALSFFNSLPLNFAEFSSFYFILVINIGNLS